MISVHSGQGGAEGISAIRHECEHMRSHARRLNPLARGYPIPPNGLFFLRQYATLEGEALPPRLRCRATPKNPTSGYRRSITRANIHASLSSTQMLSVRRSLLHELRLEPHDSIPHECAPQGESVSGKFSATPKHFPNYRFPTSRAKLLELPTETQQYPRVSITVTLSSDIIISSYRATHASLLKCSPHTSNCHRSQHCFSLVHRTTGRTQLPTDPLPSFHTE